MTERHASNRPPQRVLYCEGNLDGTIGGSFYSLLYLVEGIDRQRYQPLVVFQRDNALIPTFRETGADTHVFVLKPSFGFASRWRAVPLLGTIMLLAQKIANVWRRFVSDGIRCAWFIGRHQVDLVHLNNSVTGNHHWMLGALMAGTPCITHERGINARYSRVSRFLANRLEAVVCISRAVQQSLDRGGVRYRRAPIIHNGIDVERVVSTVDGAAIRARHGVPAGAPLVGMVGNIKAWKGQDIMVCACAALRARWPDLRCLLVGDTSADDRPFEERLRTLVREHGLDDRVIFTGYQRSVADYMNAMDVVVHASVLPEPFGRVLIEAMALGKPLVGSRDGGVTEIIVEEVTGLTFPPGDAETLAQQIARLLGDPTLAVEMGHRGRERVRQEFDVRRNVALTQSLYSEILG